MNRLNNQQSVDYNESPGLASAALPTDIDIDDEGGDASNPAVMTRVVPLQKIATRLDKVLAQLLPEYSRSRLQLWIENQQVLLDQKPATARSPVIGGEHIQVTLAPLPEEQAFQPENLPLQIIHEDAALFVIYKPAGLVVHPAAGNWSGTLLNGLLYHDAGLAQIPRAGIVHRLDKETSGLMVVARTLQAQTHLVRQLQARSVKREYLALVWGEVKQAGKVDVPIARDPRNPLRMAAMKKSVSGNISGKPAITHFSPLAHGQLMVGTRPQAVTLLCCRLETGRTHQIRVHMQHLGYPLVGDATYGRAGVSALFPRQALHAWQLGLIHPATNQPMQWQQGLPDDMQQLLIQAKVAFP